MTRISRMNSAARRNKTCERSLWGSVRRGPFFDFCNHGCSIGAERFVAYCGYFPQCRKSLWAEFGEGTHGKPFLHVTWMHCNLGQGGHHLEGQEPYRAESFGGAGCGFC